MRVISAVIPGALAFALSVGVTAAPAQAAGCIKGAIIGGIAGHYAGKHGMLGAGAGCIIGHHHAAVSARDRMRREDEAQYRQYNNGRGFDDDNPHRYR